ncbi:YlaF family protein [Sutcliffiella halmapala]|uniref:YlaF family protein n=1 Tax=Sutcliffiella halmapala TaxID=79882 RepID=UPI0014746AF1|nr:YlaF family protein [Sutcliffiella halmapala]
MKNIQWIFVLFAVLAASSLALIGIAIAERSTIGIVSAFILLFIVMGFGFRKKRSMRQ